MPSKPPQSKAKRSANRTAKKLPGKIAKRFKQRALKERYEDEIWSKVEAKKVGAEECTAQEKAQGEILTDVAPQAIAIPLVAAPPRLKGRKKGLTKRLIIAAQREKLVL